MIDTDDEDIAEQPMKKGKKRRKDTKSEVRDSSKNDMTLEMQVDDFVDVEEECGDNDNKNEPEKIIVPRKVSEICQTPEVSSSLTSSQDTDQIQISDVHGAADVSFSEQATKTVVNNDTLIEMLNSAPSVTNRQALDKDMSGKNLQTASLMAVGLTALSPQENSKSSTNHNMINSGGQTNEISTTSQAPVVPVPMILRTSQIPAKPNLVKQNIHVATVQLPPPPPLHYRGAAPVGQPYQVPQCSSASAVLNAATSEFVKRLEQNEQNQTGQVFLSQSFQSSLQFQPPSLGKDQDLQSQTLGNQLQTSNLNNIAPFQSPGNTQQQAQSIMNPLQQFKAPMMGNMQQFPTQGSQVRPQTLSNQQIPLQTKQTGSEIQGSQFTDINQLSTWGNEQGIQATKLKFHNSSLSDFQTRPHGGEKMPSKSSVQLQQIQSLTNVFKNVVGTNVSKAKNHAPVNQSAHNNIDTSQAPSVARMSSVAPMGSPSFPKSIPDQTYCDQTRKSLSVKDCVPKNPNHNESHTGNSDSQDTGNLSNVDQSYEQKDGKTAICKECDLTCYSRFELMIHVIIDHKMNVHDSEYIKCPFCQNMYKKKSGMRHHLRKSPCKTAIMEKYVNTGKNVNKDSFVTKSAHVSEQSNIETNMSKEMFQNSQTSSQVKIEVKSEKNIEEDIEIVEVDSEDEVPAVGTGKANALVLGPSPLLHPTEVLPQQLSVPKHTPETTTAPFAFSTTTTPQSSDQSSWTAQSSDCSNYVRCSHCNLVVYNLNTDNLFSVEKAMDDHKLVCMVLSKNNLTNVTNQCVNCPTCHKWFESYLHLVRHQKETDSCKTKAMKDKEQETQSKLAEFVNKQYDHNVETKRNLGPLLKLSNKLKPQKFKIRDSGENLSLPEKNVQPMSVNKNLESQTTSNNLESRITHRETEKRLQRIKTQYYKKLSNVRPDTIVRTQLCGVCKEPFPNSGALLKHFDVSISCKEKYKPAARKAILEKSYLEIGHKITSSPPKLVLEQTETSPNISTCSRTSQQDNFGDADVEIDMDYETASTSETSEIMEPSTIRETRPKAEPVVCKACKKTFKNDSGLASHLANSTRCCGIYDRDMGRGTLVDVI